MALVDKLLAKANFTLTVEPEELDVRGTFAGDPEDDREQADEIVRRADAGDVWARCWVKVTATVEYGGVTYVGTDTIGGCSYADQQDFEHSGLWDDMKSQALTALRADILSVARWEALRGQRKRYQILTVYADPKKDFATCSAQAWADKWMVSQGAVIVYGKATSMKDAKQQSKAALISVLDRMRSQVR